MAQFIEINLGNTVAAIMTGHNMSDGTTGLPLSAILYADNIYERVGKKSKQCSELF
jgi:hypothetical protein